MPGTPGLGGAPRLLGSITVGFQDGELLDRHGVPLVGGPMPRGDGFVEAFFRDPDGYVLEFFQRTGEDQSDAPERAPVCSSVASLA